MEDQGVERRLAAIIAADVVGYTRLMETNEDATLAVWHMLRTEVIDPRIAEHKGRIVKHTGDGFLAEFSTVMAAVHCAVAMQSEIAEHNTGTPDDRRMDFRVGINLSDIVVDAEDIHGNGVNIAARLEGLAMPGGICISGSVYDQVQGKTDLNFENLGEQSVKNIAKPIRVYRVHLYGDMPRIEQAGRKKTDRERLALTLIGVAILIGVIGVGLAWWKPWAPTVAKSAFDIPENTPPFVLPKRHFNVKDPANLADSDALTIYDQIRDDMGTVYQRSGNPHASVYQSWRRYNATPYISLTHGKRFINNYANKRAKAYGEYGTGVTLPEGSVLAKDSFEVTANGDVVVGPLVLMEKMRPGFNPKSRDWRYTMIMPDGSIFGTTKGERSNRMEFCIGCHSAAGAKNDHLFFIPEKHRTKFLIPRSDDKDP